MSLSDAHDVATEALETYDEAANARCLRGVSGPIHAADHTRVLVVPTNEERQIALDTLALLD